MFLSMYSAASRWLTQVVHINQEAVEEVDITEEEVVDSQEEGEEEEDMLLIDRFTITFLYIISAPLSAITSQTIGFDFE